MSENFSPAEPKTKSSEIRTDDFLARLRDVTLGGSASRPARPSETLQSACRPTDDSSFSRDFLKYRSQIQRELGKQVAGIQSVPTFRAAAPATSAARPQASSQSVSAPTPSLATPALNLRPCANPYTPCQPFRTNFSVSAAPNALPEAFQTRCEPAAASANGSASVSANVSANTPASVSANVSTNTPASISADASANAPAAKRASEPNSGNPFAKLVSPRQEVRKTSNISERVGISETSASGNPMASVSGWLASIRCFGVLGIVTGTGLTAFSAGTASGTHELTALGISLLISGAAMFASVGFFQAFRQAPNQL